MLRDGDMKVWKEREVACAVVYCEVVYKVQTLTRCKNGELGVKIAQ